MHVFTRSSYASDKTMLAACPRLIPRVAGFAGDVEGGGTESGGAGEPSFSVGEGADRKPNVFFILIDDMGYGDIGYQSTDLSSLTPNMDALMNGGRKVWRGMGRRGRVG